MRKHLIMHLDYNFNVVKYEFDLSIIDSIIEFVINSQIDIIQETSCREEEIIVCIPKYLIEYLNSEHPHQTDEQKNRDAMFLCGLKVQVSHENSIVVFYDAPTPSLIIKYIKEL